MPQAKKKAAAGTGSIRKKTRTKNGKSYTTWEGRVFLGTDPVTGKPRQQSVYGHTQKEAVEKMQKLIQEVASGTYTAAKPVKLTVGEWLDTWATDYLGNVKPMTVRSYTEHIRNHLKPALGALRLN